MQLLCIAALLLSAVAAQPGFWKPLQDGKLLSFVLDADPKRGDGDQLVTPTTGDGGGGLGGCYPDPRPQKQVPGFMFDGPGGHFYGHGRQFWRHRGHDRRNHCAVVFCPVFKVDNVTVQNVTDVTLKEGEKIFLMTNHGGSSRHHRPHHYHHHHHHQGGRQPKTGQYVRLIYNATEPNFSVEFGVFKPMKVGNLIGEKNYPYEDYRQ